MFSSLRHYQTLQNLYLSTGMYGLKIPKVKNTVALTPAIAISVRGFHHLMGGGGELFLFPVFPVLFVSCEFQYIVIIRRPIEKRITKRIFQGLGSYRI